MTAFEFDPSDAHLQKLMDTFAEMTVGEVLDLASAMGPTKYVDGPLAILVDLVVSRDLIKIYTYLLLAQGNSAA